MPLPDPGLGRGHRVAVGAVADVFRSYDLTALHQLSDEQLAAQAAARLSMYEHARNIWDDAKAQGLNPASRPEWVAVAMMCDLTMDWWSTANHAQRHRDALGRLPTATHPPATDS